MNNFFKQFASVVGAGIAAGNFKSMDLLTVFR